MIAVSICGLLACDQRSSDHGDAPQGRNVASGSDSSPASKELFVQVGGPISSLKGHDWLQTYDWVEEKEDQPSVLSVYDRPHQLTIQAPGGRTFEHYSKASFFYQKDRTVTSAQLMPLKANVSFPKAIAKLEKLFDAWGMEPTERAKKDIARWKSYGHRKAYSGASCAGYASIRGADKAVAFFEIEGADNGWYLTLKIGLTMEERRRLDEQTR